MIPEIIYTPIPNAAEKGRLGAAALHANATREQCPGCGQWFSAIGSHRRFCRGPQEKRPKPVPRGHRQCERCPRVVAGGARLCFRCAGGAEMLRDAMEGARSDATAKIRA